MFRALGPEDLRKRVSLMDLSKYKPQSDICKQWYQEGENKGMAKGKAEDVLAVLSARGIPVDEES